MCPATSTGGYLLGRDRTGPANTVNSGGGLRRMPAWFPAGDAARHLSQLVMTLVFAAEARDPSEFSKSVRVVRQNAVAAIYNSGMYNYRTIDSFVKACSDFYKDDEAWDNDTSRSLASILDERDLQRQLEALISAPVLFPQLTMVSKSELYQLAKDLYEVGKDGNHLDYDQPWGMIGGGLWTDHMGPCITVGLTALSTDQKRYNVLLHSFREATGKQIIDSLCGFFNGKQDVPLYNSLIDVKWFMAGGSPDYTSLEKAVDLATELRSRNLQVLGVQFTAAPDFLGATKAVMITADGKVAWTVY
jgi:hypothetical protein